MEGTFRPVPITILDFLAILLPGFVWVVLIDATLQFTLHRDAFTSPFGAWENLVSLSKRVDPWFAIASLVAASLLVGYGLKPIAMALAGFLATCLFKLHSDYRGLTIKDMKFPYNEFFKQLQKDKCNYYEEMVNLLADRMNCQPETLPGDQPFGAAKRYLRLAAPTLWEESERMEAEVRMAGALFLASLYSMLLSLTALIVQVLDSSQTPHKSATFSWFLISVVATYVLAEGFNRLRIREVGYTYVNALIAFGCRTYDALQQSDKWSKKEI